MEKLVCPFCPEMLTSKLNFTRSQYLGHIKKFHSADPNFFITCGFHGCPRTFKSFSYFRNHVYDIHGSGSQATCQTTPLPPAGVMEDDEGEGTVAYEPMEDDCREEHPGAGLQESEDVIGQLKKASALFILGSKERFKLTQVATQGIIEGTTNLMQLYLGALHSEVKKRLASIGVPSTDLHCLDDLFDERSDYMEPFSEVDSHHKQLKFYREHFNLIEPERVVLGEKQSWKGSGATRQLISKKNEFMYIPILKTLESMLQCDDTMAKIEKGHKETRNGILSDFCDGEAFQLSPLFSVHLNALQIFFYFDELEVVNPLGSKTKVHKLSIFYFTLGNIPPKERSKLSAIKLVAIAKHKFVNQYGMDRVLEPFVRDLKLLEKGHHFDVKGKQKLLFGTIAAVSGDNLGSLALGGFKESCSSYRICRQCMATPNPARTRFSESEFVLRDKTSHQQQCLLLNIDPNASKNYGINRDSILNELRYFHVCDGGLVPDIMHDLLEGALQYEVKLMLREMIKVEKIFSLATFNSNLTHLELGCMEAKDRPSEISDATLSSSGHGLKQSASQMSLLGRLLPLVVGRMVYDDHPKWENFLLLMEIVDILFCPMSTRDHVSYLSKRIEYHHLEFVKLYPNNSVIPKMHFIIHMPRIILQYGPLLRHWTMRYEAKHSYFKSLAHSMGNFINLPYSLAMRHQQHQCYVKNASETMTTGPVSEVSPSVVAAAGCLTCPATTAYRTKWIRISSYEFKPGEVIIHKISEDDDPELAEISEIYVVNGNILVFKATCLKVIDYLHHYRAYVVKSQNVDGFFLHDKLPVHVPVHPRVCRAVPNSTIVILPFRVDFDY